METTLSVPAPERRPPDRPTVTVARALGSTTRAGIYEHLQEANAALTVRDVAAEFDLHPNVARTHLETLADAGLVVVGRRKHPGGGRPAKVYLARDEVEAAAFIGQPPGGRASPATGVLLRLLCALLDAPAARPGTQPPTLPSRAHEAGAAEGRRLVSALPEARSGAGAGVPAVALEAAAHLVVRALRPLAPDARVVKAGAGWVDLAGLRGVFAAIEHLRGDVADALERGLVAGALAGAGAPATLSEAGTLPTGVQVWRARAAAAPSPRAAVAPAGTVDARGQQREAGVVRAMRVVTGLRPGDVLEVLAEGPGSPAAFARWADRAGHELLGVERATDATGRPAIRLLIRKGR